MPAPVPAPQPLTVIDSRRTDDFASFAGALVSHRAEQGALTLVYAPTTITTTHAPVPAKYRSIPAHPGVDVDLTGYSQAYGYCPPSNVAPLPAVPESRTFAPLAFLLSGWAVLGGTFAAALTGGNPAAIAVTAAGLACATGSFASINRGQR